MLLLFLLVFHCIRISLQDEPALSVGFAARTVFTGSGVHSFQRWELHSHSPTAADSPVSRSYLLSFRRGLLTHLPVSSPHLCIIQSHGRSDVFTAHILSVHLLRIVTYGGFHLRIIEINQIRIPLGMSLLGQQRSV